MNIDFSVPVKMIKYSKDYFTEGLIPISFYILLFLKYNNKFDSLLGIIDTIKTMILGKPLLWELKIGE